MIIPASTTFDQRTMTFLLEHDPVVQRYRAFFALFDWSMVACAGGRSIPTGQATPSAECLCQSLLAQNRGRPGHLYPVAPRSRGASPARAPPGRPARAQPPPALRL